MTGQHNEKKGAPPRPGLAEDSSFERNSPGLAQGYIPPRKAEPSVPRPAAAPARPPRPAMAKPTPKSKAAAKEAAEVEKTRKQAEDAANLRKKMEKTGFSAQL